MRKILQSVMRENFKEADEAMIAIRRIAEAGMASGLELTPAHFKNIRQQEDIWCEAMGQYVVAALKHDGLSITNEGQEG
jgi:patatin-like phospholipase/acyl hydrolase